MRTVYQRMTTNNKVLLCDMKTLFALICVVVCCMGNDYPATAHHGNTHAMERHD